jgi:hypothetical protein
MSTIKLQSNNVSLYRFINFEKSFVLFIGVKPTAAHHQCICLARQANKSPSKATYNAGGPDYINLRGIAASQKTIHGLYDQIFAESNNGAPKICAALKALLHFYSVCRSRDLTSNSLFHV